ncbi:hypothetical protein LJR289_001857 [Pseudoduganella sp. LjRoot289]|uniref:hypothetical protein n=1 Tax=Pseudoduganella sp. LjRoot289 TaxID=3342314 RepID=UPI003ECE4B97
MISKPVLLAAVAATTLAASPGAGYRTAQRAPDSAPGPAGAPAAAGPAGPAAARRQLAKL